MSRGFYNVDPCLGIFQWKVVPMSRDFLQTTDPKGRNVPVCLNMWVPPPPGCSQGGWGAWVPSVRSPPPPFEPPNEMTLYTWVYGDWRAAILRPGQPPPPPCCPLTLKSLTTPLVTSVRFQLWNMLKLYATCSTLKNKDILGILCCYM